MDVAYGVDVGGTAIRAAVVDRAGQVRWRASIPTPRDLGPEGTLDRIAELVAGAGAERGTVLGIGVGLPGVVDADKGLAGMAANLPGWEGFPAAAYLRDRLGMDAKIDHDLRVVTWGEMRCGAARGLQNFALVTIGTGVGVCIVTDGIIYRRSTGDLGHMTIDPNGRPCSCGSVGCLEQYVSGRALENEIEQAVRDGGLVRAVTVPELADMARAGHGLAKQVFDRAGRYLGFGLLNVAALINPEAFVIGGGLAQAGEVLLGPAIQVLEQHAFMFPDARRRVRRAELGDDAGVIGAASLILGRGQPSAISHRQETG